MSKKQFVSVSVAISEPPYYLMVWGTISEAGLCVAIGGKLRAEVEQAVRMLVDRGKDNVQTEHTSIMLYPNLPTGARITRWPKGVRIPGEEWENSGYDPNDDYRK